MANSIIMDLLRQTTMCFFGCLRRVLVFKMMFHQTGVRDLVLIIRQTVVMCAGACGTAVAGRHQQVLSGKAFQFAVLKDRCLESWPCSIWRPCILRIMFKMPTASSAATL